jgi:N4-gp56 family major capsid protein
MRETFGKMQIRGLIGRGDDSVIRLLTDLQKNAGDTIHFNMRALDRSAGVSGETALEGAESAMQLWQDTVSVSTKRNAHVFTGETAQKTVHDLRRESRSSMSDWFSWGLEAGVLAHLAGNTGIGNESAEPFLYETTGGTNRTGADVFGNTVAAIDAGHLVDGTGGVFNIGLVEDAIAKAKTANPRVAPARIDGRTGYICLVHPYAARNLRQQLDETSTGGWLESMRSAGVRGEANPIWTGAIGWYGGALIVENEFVPYDSTGAAETAYNLLLGSNAGAIGFGNAWGGRNGTGAPGGGQYFRMVEDVDDYGFRTGYGVSSIMGVKRSTFDSASFGTIVITSRDVAP